MVIFALAKNMSHKASLTSKTESGPTWSNQPSTNWHKRGTTALEELAMQNKKSLQIKQISRTKYYLPTSLISLTMLTSILYQHLTMQMRRDVSPSCYFILAYCTILRYTTHPMMKIGISREPWRTKLAAAALQSRFSDGANESPRTASYRGASMIPLSRPNDRYTAWCWM